MEGRVFYEPDNPSRVRHIVDGRLKKGVQYRVYVSQVNNKGMESPKSVPAYIMVGDTTPPPTPDIAIDDTVYANGCHAEGDKCEVYVRWYMKPTPDISRFEIFKWNERPEWYKQDGEYPAELAYTADGENFVGSAEYSSFVRCVPGHDVYIGIRAVDLSRNSSPVRVMRVLVADASPLMRPTSLIHAEPYGAWAIKVTVDCPRDLENIKAVEIFRDGETRVAAFLFDKGQAIQCIDPADYDSGLQHYYTFRFITEDGRVTPMSAPSLPVTANVIDTSYMDEAELKAFNNAWSGSGLESVNAIKSKIEESTKTNAALQARLDDATKNYSDVVSNYQRLVNDFQQISVESEENDKAISALRTSLEQTGTQVALKATKQEVDKTSEKLTARVESVLSVGQTGISTSVNKLSRLTPKVNGFASQIEEDIKSFSTAIEQNANEIALRATSGSIDMALEQTRKDIVSQLEITEKSITSVVNRQDKIKSSITQLNNEVGLCVRNSSLKSTITLAIQNGISSAVIRADRVVVNGECILQGNARCVGKWASNTFSIVDPRTGRPIWGSDTGTVKPQVVTFEHGFGSGNWRLQWVGGNPDWRDLDMVRFTPNPPVKFNGVSTVKITVTGIFHVSQPTPAVRAGAIPPPFPNSAMIGIYLVDGNVSGDQNNYHGSDVFSQNAPVAAVWLGGVGKIVGTGANASCSGGSGWSNYYYSRQWYTYTTNFTIQCTKSLYIGKQTDLHFLARVLNRSPYNTDNIGIQNIRWRIECS